jgi:hypothetical protein
MILTPKRCMFVLCQSFVWKMLDLQHQYNNCTTIPHMRVGLTYWGLPSCEGLLYSCCIGVVQESNLLLYRHVFECEQEDSKFTLDVWGLFGKEQNNTV